MIESLKNKSNSIALIGSSNDPRKYGNKILLDLTKKGYTVYPVNKKEKEIEGLKAYKLQRSRMQKVLEYENDINTLKSEISEIRTVLDVIVNKLNN